MNFLSADLGGTKTLLAIFKGEDSLNKIYENKYISKNWNSFDSIISDFFNNLPKDIEHPNYGCIAVAGRVLNNKSKITNLKWDVNSEKLCDLTRIKKIELINDFSVLIYGIKHLKEHQYEIIQGSFNNFEPSSNGLVAVLGAGTGLGVARGLINSKGIHILPSEGGHREFSPRDKKEWELFQWLKNDLGLKRLSLERIVSGTGLGNIARWLLMQPQAKFHPLRQIAEDFHSHHSKKIDMASIASQEAHKGDQLMLEALEMWLSAYGSAAGDIALQELCYSGLWIAGGTAQKHIGGLKSTTFLKAFKEKGRFKNFLGKIPVIAITDPEIGLFSAGCRASLLPSEMGDLS